MTANKTAPTVGERVELARYTIASGNRILYGQRVNGVVRITDVPAVRGGRAYLVERELEYDGYAALQATVRDYIAQAALCRGIPMASCPFLKTDRAGAATDSVVTEDRCLGET